MKMKWIVFVMLFGMVIGCLSLYAQATDTPQPPKFELTSPLPFDPKTLTGQLPNGLRYYIRENKKPENRVELRLVLKAGSILEDDDQQGLAHFLEHMAFNGTKNFAKQALVEYLESIGMEFGPEVNASTGFDATLYRLTVPTDQPEFVEKGFQILEDWAHQMTLADQDFDQERGVLLEEWRVKRGAAARLRDKHYPVLYHNSRYAERLPIGKTEIIESFAYDTLRRYYRDWYRPDLMAVMAVGDFQAQTMLDLITRHFAPLTNPASPRPRTVYPVPDHDQFLFTLATDPELTETSAQLYFKRNVTPEKTVADYRRLLLEHVYTVTLNQRFEELSKQANPPFLSAYAAVTQLVKTKDAYVLGVDLKDENIAGGIQALLQEAERVRRHGFTSTELERTKKLLLRQMEKWYQERDKMESGTLVQGYIGHFLQDDPVPGIEAEYLLFQQYIPDIQLAELNQLSDLWMTPQNRVFSLSAPEKTGVTIPTEQEIQTILTAVTQEELQPYTDAVSNAPLLPELPKPGEIVAEKRIDALDVTEWTLSNGVRVALKPTDFKNDEVLFSSFSPGGNSLVPDSDYVSAAWADDLIGESGVGEFSKILLEKKLADKMVRVSPTIAGVNEAISGSGSPQDLETMFQLIYLYFTAPRLDEQAITAYLSRVKEDVENRRAEPLQVFYDLIQTAMTQGHYRTRPLTVEILDEIQPLKSLAIYKDRFADASDFTFFFVGNFTLEGIKPLILTYLAGLPALHRQETWKDVGIRSPTGKIEQSVTKGIEPKSQVVLSFTGDYVWSRQANYDIDALIGALDIRLRESIREEKSGTYGVGVDYNLSHYPTQEYEITISFGCDPKRVDELVTAALQEVERLQTTPLEETYLTRVKQTNLRSYETSLKKNNYWLNVLWSAYYHQDNPVELIVDYPKLVEAMSAESIQKAAQQYFNLNNYAKFVLYPEQQAATK